MTLTTTQAIDALVARKPAAIAPLEDALIFGVQAQADAAVSRVSSQRIALATYDMNGKLIEAGFANLADGRQAKTSRRAA